MSVIITKFVSQIFLATCYIRRNFSMFSLSPVPVINIFSVSSFFYNPSRISFAPFSHFIQEKANNFELRRSHVKLTTLFPDPVPSEWAKCIMGQYILEPSVRSFCFSNPATCSNMAEENGVAEVNGKTEELAIENEQCDEEEKGTYLLILHWLYFACGIARRMFYKYSLGNLHFTRSS